MRQGRRNLFACAKLVLLVVGSMLFLCLGFEVYLRQQGYLSAVPANYPCVTGHPKLNHVFKENCEALALASALKTAKDVTYHTNSLGFRGAELVEGGRRLVMIGDSYTEGFGLADEETLPARVEAEWKKTGEKNIQIINAGILGFSPVLYPLYYQLKLISLKPQFVLLNLDFTDLNDDVYFLKIANYNGDGRPVAFSPKETFPVWLLPFVYSNKSALLRFFHQEWNQWNLHKLEEKNKPFMEAFIEPSKVPVDWLESSNMQKCAKSVAATLRSVRELRDLVLTNGGRFAIHMYLPGTMVKKYPNQPQGISFVRTWLQKKQSDYSWHCPSNEKFIHLIRLFAAQERILFFDSSQDILGNSRAESLYFDRDAHWNAEGAAFVAKKLSPKLLRAFEAKR